MYSEQKETTDKIKVLLRQLIASQSQAPVVAVPMITSDTTSAHKRKEVELLDHLIKGYLDSHQEQAPEVQIVDVQTRLSQLNHSNMVVTTMEESANINHQHNDNHNGSNDHNNSSDQRVPPQ
jgi:hypothetical protein